MMLGARVLPPFLCAGACALLGALLGACDGDAPVVVDAGVDASALDGASSDALLGDAAGDAPADADGSALVDAGPVQRIRILAGNLSSGSSQNYDSGEGIRILQGLVPDVAMIQEFNYLTNSTTDIRGFVDTAFGSQFAYIRGLPGNQIPNGVISRFPILASGDWIDPQVANRDFTWARIDAPGPHDLWAISVHLLTTGANQRNAEATALVGFVQQNVPSGDYVAIAGDFNTASRAEPCVTTFAQIVADYGPYPADQASNENTNAPRNAPYDWVIASPALDAAAVPVVLGTSSFTHGLVFDSRVYTPLTDVPPVLVSDSAAVNMQHMAVVRDFDLPL
jgi:endonuclease/exonuclease/phosphatase family metal-dependent hydrolase